MEYVVAFIESLNTANWIAIAAIIVGIFFGWFTAANYFAGRRERTLKKLTETPEVKATINNTGYENGWRSVSTSHRRSS
jgi:hypothetical protein